MATGEWSPTGVDLTTPNTARIYDYLLGGKDNYDADRRVGDELIEIIPEARAAARQNHLFIGRAVRYLVKEGVRQFVDIGTKLPAAGNVHEVAAAIAPDARVVFADDDPVTLTHARALLTGTGSTLVARTDPRRPDAVIDDPEVRRLIDFDRPVAVVLDRVLHFIEDVEEAVAVVARLHAALPSGSHLVFTVITDEPAPEASDDVSRVFRPTSGFFWSRRRAEVERMVAPFALVDPGLTYTPLWRPDPAEDEVAVPEHTYTLAGVGRRD
ncbi:SAM-dependent methyltransferase [Actinomadura rugatobispora]|uniref:SAM-dependent methyltransferase n=1 Tax=Actinomadura rugatobispora TaxID=1994 RepID=A0ABW1A8Z0_9ACTN|nr:SAM-dependent methyltransferase [Actinomadura rugatobispora]